MIAKGTPHTICCRNFLKLLPPLLAKDELLQCQDPIRLPNASEPEPDIAVVQDLGREYLNHHPYPENVFWIIEYSESSLSKDLGIKTNVYADVNIPEYWVVNLKSRVLIVIREPVEGQ